MRTTSPWCATDVAVFFLDDDAKHLDLELEITETALMHDPEGVEDARTLALLREMGCDQAQGYCFSRPLPWADIEAWLEASSR